MSFETYQQDAIKTRSSQFHTDLVSHWDLEFYLRGTIRRTEALDEMKKALFYGKPTKTLQPVENGDYLSNQLEPDVVHMLLGVITEAGELAELLLQHMKDHQVDKAKLVDESGDVLWYLANLMDVLDVSLGEAASRNITKLKTRFPDKFTSEAAINRDVKAEGDTFTDLSSE